jgi:hypothetical protein
MAQPIEMNDLESLGINYAETEQEVLEHLNKEAVVRATGIYLDLNKDIRLEETKPERTFSLEDVRHMMADLHGSGSEEEARRRCYWAIDDYFTGLRKEFILLAPFLQPEASTEVNITKGLLVLDEKSFLNYELVIDELPNEDGKPADLFGKYLNNQSVFYQGLGVTFYVRKEAYLKRSMKSTLVFCGLGGGERKSEVIPGFLWFLPQSNETVNDNSIIFDYLVRVKMMTQLLHHMYELKLAENR